MWCKSGDVCPPEPWRRRERVDAESETCISLSELLYLGPKLEPMPVATRTFIDDAMSKVTRIGVTFPPELLKDFDEIISKMGYESRSKAIQDAVTLYVSERNWIKEENTIQTGVILMV